MTGISDINFYIDPAKMYGYIDKLLQSALNSNTICKEKHDIIIEFLSEVRATKEICTTSSPSAYKV